MLFQCNDIPLTGLGQKLCDVYCLPQQWQAPNSETSLHQCNGCGTDGLVISV